MGNKENKKIKKFCILKVPETPASGFSMSPNRQCFGSESGWIRKCLASLDSKSRSGFGLFDIKKLYNFC